MSNNIYKKFKKTGIEEYFEMVPYSADTAMSATTAQNAEAIGNVEKYSGVYGDKQREGLKFKNGSCEAVVELNEKGNFSMESLTKHLNLESAKGVQIKPTTTLIIDSSRRIEKNSGNELNVEAKFDDYGDAAYNGKEGYDDSFAELHLKARSIDLRCHGHGGIALQIANTDNNGKENKIKFESDRISEIGATPRYKGPRKGAADVVSEGGKGMEFGTFNNEHASLYCGDYRFKGDAEVYGVTRGSLEQNSKGKIDYPTQADDFKDILDQNKKATWNEIIDAAKKCKNLDETITAEVARQALSGNVDASVFVTKSEVEDVVAQAMSDASIDTTGLATKEWVLDQDYIDSLPEGLQYVKVGKDKGNFQIDVTGKYTWEQTGPKSATTVDEYGNVAIKGDRVVNYSNEAFYLDENKVYYKAGMETTLADGETVVPADTIVYNAACNLDFTDVSGYSFYQMNTGETSFYEDPNKFAYKAKIKNAPKYDGSKVDKNKMVEGAGLTQEEIDYYESLGAQYDEEGNEVVAAIWEKVDIWKKSTLWTKNEININLETDSKIKFAGKKIETVWTYDDVDHKMAEILLSTESLAADANEVVFEQKISKNGDRSGQDTELVYSFGNNVADTDKVENFAAFKTNYDSKHKNHGKSVEELQAMYDAFLAEGQSFEIRVKVSELLGLVARVADLERRIALLEGQTPEQEGE